MSDGKMQFPEAATGGEKLAAQVIDDLRERIGEYGQLCQDLCMGVMYKPCEPVSHSWPGRLHRDCLREGVEHLIKENERLRRYVGNNLLRSDYRSADHMRDTIDGMLEAVHVLARNLSEYTMSMGTHGQIINCCSDEVVANPIALAAVVAASKAGAGETLPERRKVDVIQVCGFPRLPMSSSVYLSVIDGSIEGMMGACRHCGQGWVVVPYSEWKGTVLVVIDGKMDVPDFLECDGCKRKRWAGVPGTPAKSGDKP